MADCAGHFLQYNIRADHHLKHADAGLPVVQAGCYVAAQVGVERCSAAFFSILWRASRRPSGSLGIYGRLCWHLPFVHTTADAGLPVVQAGCYVAAQVGVERCSAAFFSILWRASRRPSGSLGIWQIVLASSIRTPFVQTTI